MKAFLGALAAVAMLCASPAMADPLPVNTNLSTDIKPTSTTITTHGTFQTLLAPNFDRHGCLIQNKSIDTVLVYFGATASATADLSVALGPASVAVGAGGAVYCNGWGVLWQGNVAVTSLTADGTAKVLVLSQ